jgi:flagellar hook-basal body complex protein FliE
MENFMSISFNSAISAYRNAASYATNPGSDNTDATSGQGGGAFAGLIEQPATSSISSLRSAERTAIGSLTKQADITDVVSAVTQAETTLKTVIAVRDRLISAFQDLEKMPI